MSNSLKARCAKSSFTLTIATVISKLISFVSKMILAKLMLPEERGVLVIILPLVTFFETFSEIGVKHSVIQHKEGAAEEYLNMAWWIQTVRSVLLYLAAFLISPILCHIWVYGKSEIVDLYSRTELLWMLRVTFLTILFNGLVSPKAFVLIKNFQFVKNAFLAQGSMILGNIATIVLFYYIRSVWAFVAGSTFGYLFQAILSYILCPFRPKLSYNRNCFHSLMHFSKGMFGLPLLTYFTLNIDVLVGSLFVSPGMIGMYGFAMGLARTPREILTRIFGPLLIPAFSEKQDQHDAVCKGLLYITRLLGIVAFPIMTFCIIESDAILSVIYKPEFTEVSGPFCFLCVVFMVLLLTVPLSKIFFGLGVPGNQRLSTIVQLVLLGGLIWPTVQFFGMLGVSILLVATNLITMGCQLILLKRLIKLDLIKYFKTLNSGIILTVFYTITGLIVAGVFKSSQVLSLGINLILMCLFIACGLVVTVIKAERFKLSRKANP